MAKPTRLAAIDIGTNSFHLIVVESTPVAGRFRILGRQKENVRLGSGMTDMKYLSDETIERGISALRLFKRVAESMQAPVRAVATSAVREALNKQLFMLRAETETGIRIQIASGAEEARLIHLGVLQALPVFRKRLLMLDIGGGSTEFLLGERRNILFSNSLKLGAVRLTQRFFPDGKTTAKSIKECRSYVRGFLAPVTRELKNRRNDVRVGSSGTILSLAAMIRLRRDGEAEGPLNGFTFSNDELFEMAEDILSIDRPEDRLSIEGLDASRADIIPAGVIILEQAMRELGLPDITVSEFALREGIILDTLEKRLPRGRVDHLHDIRMNSVRHLAETFRYEQQHADHVTRLALRLFDQLKPVHRLSDREREYLEAAGILHEIGLYVSHAQHHRHSYYLIRNAELLGFTENEKEIIANIARYHRKSHPKVKHEGFRTLTPDEQKVVAQLAGILRVADGLDRNHQMSIRDVRALRTRNSVRLKLTVARGANAELEVWGAERKKGLFEEAFGVSLKVDPLRSMQTIRARD